MSWGFFEGLGMLVFTVYVGGMCLEAYERWRDRRSSHAARLHSTSAQPPTVAAATLPSPEALEAFLARMEPVRRALSRMGEEERDHWHRKAHETINEVQAIDYWLQAVSSWAPHQRKSVEQTAQEKVEARQRLIMDFARGVLQAAPPTSPPNEPAGRL